MAEELEPQPADVSTRLAAWPGEMLFWISLVSILGFALALIWSATAVDDISRRWEERQLTHGIETRMRETESALMPQVVWDDAVRHLDNRFDADWAEENLGVYLTQLLGVEWIFVIDADDQPRFAMIDGKVHPASAFAEIAPNVASAVASVRRRERERASSPSGRPGRTVLSDPIQVTGVGPFRGQWAGFTASLVGPDFGRAMPRGPRAPIVVSGRRLEPGSVALMADRYQISGARLATLQSPRRAGEAVAILRDFDARPVATFRWTARRPGTAMLERAGPILAIVAGALVCALVFLRLAARRARRALMITQDDLRDALRQAQAADKSKTAFLTAVSHELRTPLNSISGALHLLRSEPVSPAGTKLLDVAASGSLALSVMVNDILDVAADSQGLTLLSPAPIDVAAAIDAVVAEFAPECASRGISFEVSKPDGLGLAMLDEARLRQCLRHLIGNAVKFTERGRIKVSACFEFEESERRLRIDVEDTGCGINEEALLHIFERFSQADGSLTRGFGGAGIGLCVTRTLAVAMGGSVDVQSRVGEGSTFTLRVTAPEAAPPPEDLSEGPFRGFRILVVDDNPSNLTVASKILEQFGATTRQAESGPEALQLCGQTSFDIVLMDIQMPVMDGMETTRRLRDLAGPNATVPVVALTANVLPEQCEAYLAAGMNGVVSKPVSPPAIFHELVRVISEQDEDDSSGPPNGADAESGKVLADR